MRCTNDTQLTYTAYDDGVHVMCAWDYTAPAPLRTCGFDKNIGFYATSVDVIRAENEHSEREL